MSYVPPGNAAATARWADLVAELDRWGAAGRTALLWWRDDDAVAATAQLADLLRLAGPTPLGLAVIPGLARSELAAALEDQPNIAVLQHGWRHVNLARKGKKSECPPGRAVDAAANEIAAGKARLESLFGPRSLPVFVPPWNRFAAELLPILPSIGIAGISAMPSLVPQTLPAGLRALHVHIDVVAWRDDRRFVGNGLALGGLIRHLRFARRTPEPSVEPIGLLTHHLVMDAAAGAFLERLIPLVHSHPAARWAAPTEFFAEVVQ